MESNTIPVGDLNVNDASGTADVKKEILADDVKIVDTDIKPEDTVAYSTYTKLLNEKKKQQELLADANRKVTEVEENKLKESGRYKDLSENLQGKVTTLESQLKTEKQQRGYDLISGQIRAIGTQEGCQNNEILLNNCDFSELDPSGDGKATEQSIRHIIAKFQKENPFMFRKSMPGVKDMTPSSAPMMGNKNKDDMSMAELEEKFLRG